MAVTGSMNAKHARSPVIKIVAGENEIFSEEDPDAALNVFYVAKSLLIESSSYFAIVLDSTPERAVVFLPEHDYEVVENWLNLIFNGTLNIQEKLPLAFATIQKYFVFANLVGSEKLKNVITDSFQEHPIDWTLNSLRALQDDYSSLTTIFDIILEYHAWVIVTEGWAGFWGSPDGIVAWNKFICDQDNCSIVNQLLLKIDELNSGRLRKRLICPSDRKDCKWHEHLNDETKAKCPGRNGKPDAVKVVINGIEHWDINDSMLKTNGNAYNEINPA
ncbi:hypothetical protein H2200_000294 [Cladophialophora chaetospira]|uniref:BTB domain-containing protein n=1 Tax=Cladophialophora chaetospira TaxID=386627 RepID=A0AA38XN56_9EURO|nr:hypothetical protein H2200_000294 [Cladophialophora chaetospira]